MYKNGKWAIKINGSEKFGAPWFQNENREGRERPALKQSIDGLHRITFQQRTKLRCVVETGFFGKDHTRAFCEILNNKSVHDH